MYSALYYPHTSIRSEEILKTALLFWDTVEYLVPYPEFRPDYNGYPAAYAKACEMVGVSHYPTEAEKDEVHEKIDDLVSQAPPEPFQYQLEAGEDYELWPGKLAEKTWRMLDERGIIGRQLDNLDYPASRPAGLCIMSVLADCCAGNTRMRITDQGAAYAAIATFLQGNDGSIANFGAPSVEALVPVTLKVVDVDRLSLEQLIHFRERERSAGGHEIRDLRHRFVDSISSQAKKMADLGARARDRENLLQEFEDQMKDDLSFLKDALKVAKNEALLSKEFLTAVLSTAAAFAGPVLMPIAGAAAIAGGGGVAIGGLIGVRNKYVSSRKEIMRKHPMAYLYEIKKTL